MKRSNKIARICRTAQKKSRSGHARHMAQPVVTSVPSFRLAPLTAAILASFGVSAPAWAGPNVITPDGRTQTRLDVHGQITDINTQTVSGKDGFNSFHRFEEADGSTVNLHLPGGTDNLINLVHDRKILINGTLNSLKNGELGGHVFFADPHGMLVGTEGVLNVGTLSVSTPTQQFVDGVIGPSGIINAASVSALKAGTAPQAADATVDIKGQVNAPHGVRIHARTVDASGVILIQQQPGADTLSAGAAVNIGQTAAQPMLARSNDGGIQIIAASDVHLSGTLRADGAQTTGGSSVLVAADGDATLNGATIQADRWGSDADGGAVTVTVGHDLGLKNTDISANAGTTGDGGTITVLAGHDATVDNLQVSARGGDQGGHGGTVEVSAIHSEMLSGASFDLSAPKGTGGLLSFDPDDLTISGQVNTNGAVYTQIKAGTITVENGGVINTRMTSDSGSSAAKAAPNDVSDLSKGDSGNISLEAPIITLNSGAQLLAFASGGYTAGDISLTAEATDNQPFGLADAETAITVNGTLKGGNIDIAASSEATADYSDLKQSISDTLDQVASVTGIPTAVTDLISKVVGNGVPPPPLGVEIANANAKISIGATADIEADGHVDIEAETNTKAATSALNSLELTQNSVLAAGVFGEVTGHATATVASSANVQAGQDFSLKAINNDELEISAEASGSQSTVGLTAAIGAADINATATIDSGADISAGNVTVLAHNSNSFGVEAKVDVADGSTAGLAAALAFINTAADAEENANLGTSDNTIGSLVVDASSSTAKTEVGTETAAGNESDGSSPIDVVGSGGGDLPGFLEGKLSDYFTKADTSTAGETGQTSGSEDSSSLRLGSAVALTDSTQKATAKIGDDTTVNASGQVAVLAATTSEDVHNSAGSETTSGDGNSADLSISLAVAVGLYHNNAQALIGNDADITADHIGVGSHVELPWDLASVSDFSNVPETLSTIYDDLKQSGAPLTTGYADAESDTGDVGVSGAVNFLAVNDDATAWVGTGAQLISNAADHATWSTTVDIGPDESDPSKEIQDEFKWKAAVDIAAESLAQVITDAGNFKLLSLNGTGGEGSATSVGGGVDLVNFDNTTLAGIGSGATVTASTLAVDADATDQLITITPSAGRGSGISANVIFAMANVDDHTHASIDSSANVNADAVDVSAHQGLGAWSIAGAISQGSSAGVGVGIAVNNLKTDTAAYIADNSADAQFVGDTATTPPNIADAVLTAGTVGSGSVNTAKLTVKARTDGRSGAIAVSGAAASSSNKEGGSQGGSGGGGSGSGGSAGKLVGEKGPVFLDLTQNFLFNPDSETSGFTPENVLSSLPLLTQLFSSANKEEGQSDSGGGGSEKKPKFGLAVSGSATVNLAKLGTTADLDGATVHQSASGTASEVTVNAINNTQLISASGAGALASAKNSSSNFSAGIAGAVAYSLIENPTRALIRGSTLSNTGDVTVQALSGGSELDLGLGLSVNTSGGNSSAAVAGSASISQVTNTTAATVADSSLTGGGDVTITGYDHTDIGAGGGSLAVGGKGGVGVAVTYSDIKNVASSLLQGGSLDGYNDVSVKGLSASRIADGAATIQASSQSKSTGLEGAFVVNQITNTTKGLIQGDSSGAATLTDIGGDVTVRGAGEAPDDDLDNIIDGGTADPIVSLVDFTGAAIGGDDAKGTAIFAVAGAVGASSNNVGVSFAYNDIGDTFSAGIEHADISTSGAVAVEATDDTRIIGLGVGLSLSDGDFAGLGSATANLVNDNVTATVGDSAAVTNTTTINAASLKVVADNSAQIDTLAGSVAIATNGAAAGVAISFNEIGNQTKASITHSQVTTTGSDTATGCDSAVSANVLVQGCSSGDIESAAVAGAVGDGIALAGSFSINDIGTEDATPLADLRETYTHATVGNSTVTAHSLGVDATNSATIQTLSGGIAASAGEGSVGAAFSIDNIAANTAASLADSELDINDAVQVTADSSGKIKGISVGGSVSDGFAAAGSLTDNLIGNTTTADASGMAGIALSTKASMQSLTVKATDSATIQSLAGAVALAAGDGAVGGAAGFNAITDTTSATLEKSALDVAGTTDVRADSSGDIQTLAVAAAGSGGVALAGAATTNTIGNTISAKVSNVAVNDTSNDTTISASDDSSITSSADSAGVGADGGGGAAVAVNHIGNGVTAELSGGTYHARNVTVAADSSNPNSANSANIQTLAAGVGGGGEVGGAASVAVNVETGSVTADITGGADVTAEDNVAVTAHNRQGIDVFAGSLGIGVTAGLGFGLVVNDLQGTTSAYIDGTDTHVNALAKHSSDQLNVASGQLSHPDSLDVTQVHSRGDYAAPDLSEAAVNVTGLAVNAASQQSVATLGLSLAVSFDPEGSAALSAMIGANVLGGTTQAYIQDAQINQGDDQNRAGTDQRVSVIGSSHTYAANFVAGFAGGTGDVAAAGAVDVNAFDQSTQAYLSGVTLTSKGETGIDAEASQRAVGIAAGLAAAITGGAGTGILNLFNADTEAYVVGDSVDNATPPPDLAWVASTINAGSLSVKAKSENDANLDGGSGAFGAAGLAGTFLLGISNNTTDAYIGDENADTTLHVPGSVTVRADSVTNLSSTTLTASAGSDAIAGMAAVTVVGNHTNAYLNGVQLDQDTNDDAAHSVTVAAQETLDLSPTAGSVAVGGGGHAAGASANVIVLDSQVSAAIENSQVNAKGGAVAVTAESDKTINMTTISGALGADLGISGAAGVIVFGQGSLANNDQGDDPNDELNKGGDGTLSKLGSFGTSSPVSGDETGNTLSSSELTQVNSASQVSLLDGNGNLNQGTDGTTANITHSHVDSAGLTVQATDTNAVSNIVGNLAAGGFLGAGGAVGFTLVYDTVGATVDSDSVLNATGTVLIDAEVDNGTIADALNGLDSSQGQGGISGLPVINDGNRYAVQTIAVQGAAGGVGLGAAVAISEIDNTVQANVAGTIHGNDTNTLEIDANDKSGVTATGGGASVGGLAAGVVVAQAKKSSSVVAAIGTVTADSQSDTGISLDGSNTTADQLYGITLHASDGGASVARAAGVAAGLTAAANAADANSSDVAKVTAGVGHSASVSAGSSGVDVEATDHPQTEADAFGLSIGGYVGLGASVATAADSPTVTAMIGDEATIEGAGATALKVAATNAPLTDEHGAYAHAVGGAGGVLFGADASVAAASSDATVVAQTGNGVGLPLGAVAISAINTTDQSASATGVGVGFIGIGGHSIPCQRKDHDCGDSGRFQHRPRNRFGRATQRPPECNGCGNGYGRLRCHCRQWRGGRRQCRHVEHR
ncbi:leukotoxin LktA family filamentous adhesin [Salinisphaera sp. LB1]|uniref:leukotoxin LktA family filamentous adhesin n=1 Tax=Salinisphaera sp. LB1 TaxID=2183911 RepID=UPI000D708BB4|nr:leukotoxin LktA family filamentous adhesin [Salinisphaera sp. LB1]